MIKITHNGRPFDPKRFAKEIEDKVMDAAMTALEEKARGAAATIIDPETGKHADVFVDRAPDHRVFLRTKGSPAFARLVEKRLGVDPGTVEAGDPPTRIEHPKVYLAHATEDKPIVRPLAEYLMANGVDVWLDEWDIDAGDSLRQKMEEGLGWMTHFMVILTPVALGKPWVQREIDVGIQGLVGGTSRMVPLRVGTQVSDLPRFLQTMLCLEIDPADEAQRKALVGRLHGVSRKPVLGDKPQYVKEIPAGISGWSEAAIAIGRYLTDNSLNALPFDPAVTVDQLIEATKLDRDDARVGLLDLKEAGYIAVTGGGDRISPEKPLFVDFDEVYVDFSPARDAVEIANRFVSGDKRDIRTVELAEELGWPPRRINSAICYLERAGAVGVRSALGSRPFRVMMVSRTDRTLRFARSHA